MMEVVVPARAMDFDFNTARSSPCSSIPSTPKRFGDDYSFLSAPTSPTRISDFYLQFENFLINDSRSRGGAPFDWEEMPGTPKSPKKNVVAAADDDFAFGFNQDLEKTSLSAEELFDGGVIRPLKPPPRLQLRNRIDDSSKTRLLSPRSPKEIIRNVFSPRRKKVSDPIAAAVDKTRKPIENERGRDRVAGLPKNSSRRGARSLSPYRVSQFPWEEEEEKQQPQQQQQAVAKQSQENSESIVTSSSSKSSSRRWRLKNFLLFRSASEGRASDRDPLRKYSGLSRKHEDAKTSSFRSTDGSGSKRRGPVSAHELHYTKNKAATENLKRRTFLPYKTGILGVLGFN